MRIAIHQAKYQIISSSIPWGQSQGLTKILLLWLPEAKVTPCPLVCDDGQVIGVVGITKSIEEDAVPHQGVHQGEAHIGQWEIPAQRLSVVSSLVAELQGCNRFMKIVGFPLQIIFLCIFYNLLTRFTAVILNSVDTNSQ